MAPDHVLVLTFTRKAVAELRERVLPHFAELESAPRIMTLHGFALRQLLRNAHLVDVLPSPLRVADDWEEERIIVPDLQRLLKLDKSSVMKHLFGMSADWDSVSDAEANADPKFVAAWRTLRQVYGFTLRAEMVYRLKKAMEQHDKFELESQFDHVIVDEFQDLNPCDLAVVAAMRDLGAHVYCAGDDDQSIYGFRKASPAGIRTFVDDYPRCEDHKITVCKRCDADILKVAEFVADQDLARIPKGLIPESDGGLVQLAHFSDQDREAAAIASACKQLHDMGYQWADIAVLLRSDRYGRFSEPIVAALHDAGVPVSTHRTTNPVDEDDTRFLFALLQLAVVPTDSMAARTLLQLSNGVGSGTIEAIEGFAVNRSVRFIEAVKMIAADPSAIGHAGPRVTRAWSTIETALVALQPLAKGEGEPLSTAEDIRNGVAAAASALGATAHATEDVVALFGNRENGSLSDIVNGNTSVAEGMEPQISAEAVNIMTMHQAKGLTFECVIIPCLEDQLMPGDCMDAAEEGDERRLLYVSMTRAKHALILLYATKRTGAQGHSGRPVGAGKERTLTRFLTEYKFK